MAFEHLEPGQKAAYLKNKGGLVRENMARSQRIIDRRQARPDNTKIGPRGNLGVQPK